MDLNELLAQHDTRLDTDALTGFWNRERLLADLDRAVTPGSPDTVLAVFDLKGLREYRDRADDYSTSTLIERMAAAFATAVRPSDAGCYRPRVAEFCIMTGADWTENCTPRDVVALLANAARAMSREAAGYGVRPAFGASILPDEASTAVDALIVADERLRVQVGTLEWQNLRQ